MIKCPRCKTTEGITAVRWRGPRDAISFQFNCSACGVMWKRSWGVRRREIAEQRRKEMENVEIVKSRLDRKLDEDRAKMKRGECPRCGGKLTVVVDEERSCERLVRSDTTCDGCDFSSQAFTDRAHWEKNNERDDKA